MSTRSVIYNLQLNSNATKVLQETEAHAKKLDGAMWQLQKSLAAFGVGLGAHFMKDFALDMVEGATEMERAMLRIKNVSENSLQGMKNQFFIRGEVDKFKIDLQDATDAYGDFLTMVRGSGLAGAEVRKLHDEVLTIGKVTGISKGQMDASVRNLGKLLEEGALEGRHLRPLTYQMSGLMPYISKELGMTNQELEGLISSGKLTKANIDSKVLLDAIEKYANDLLPKLDESLQTIESHTNDAKNAWLEFKNELVLDNKGELNEFIDTLRDGAKWLTDHKDEIVEVGGAVANIAEFYIKWRLALLALQTPSMVLGFMNTEMTRMDAILGTTTLDTEKQVVAQNAFNASLAETIIEYDQALASGTAYMDAEIGLSQVESALIAKRREAELSMQRMNAFLVEGTIQMDLFTEAQIRGAEFAPTQAISEEYRLKIARLEELQIKSTEFFEKEQIYGNERIVFESKLNSAISQSNAIYEQRIAIMSQIEKLQVDMTIQGNLFTEQELQQLEIQNAKLQAELKKINVMDLEFELMQTLNAKAIADAEALGVAWFKVEGVIGKSALQASKLVTESKLMADSFVVGAEKARIAWEETLGVMQAGMHGVMEAQALESQMMGFGNLGLGGVGINGALSGISGKGLVSGAMNVFMVGMAADLIADIGGLYAKSSISGKELGFWKTLEVGIAKFGSLSDILLEDYEIEAKRRKSKAYIENEEIIKENKWRDLVQKNLPTHGYRQGIMNELDPTNPQRDSLSWYGTEIMSAMKKADSEMGTANVAKLVGYTNYIKGTYDTSNIDLYEKMKSRWDLLPLESSDARSIGDDSKSREKYNSHKIDKIKNERIKGNSSHYITINIDEMNGMNNPTFTVSSSYDMKNIEKQVGDSLVKILTGVVNDSQLIGK